MGKPAECHWFPTSIGRLTDDGYKRGIAEDLRADKTVKRHSHYYNEDGIPPNECDCPVEGPDNDGGADQGSGVGSSPSSESAGA